MCEHAGEQDRVPLDEGVPSADAARGPHPGPELRLVAQRRLHRREQVLTPELRRHLPPQYVRNVLDRRSYWVPRVFKNHKRRSRGYFDSRHVQPVSIKQEATISLRSWLNHISGYHVF